MDTSKRSHEALMTFNMVSWKGVLMREVKEPIRVLRLIATRKCKVSSQISFAPNDKVVRAGTNTTAFRLWVWQNFRQCCEYLVFFNLFLSLFTRWAIQTAAKTQNIFILVRNSNMNGDMYNWRYQTRETNEHQSGPSSLVIYPGYQQFHPINVSTSHNESPACSESPSGSSCSGSEHVNKRWEATEVKILISAYKDHHENLNKQAGSCWHDSKRIMDIRHANSLESTPS